MYDVAQPQRGARNSRLLLTNVVHRSRENDQRTLPIKGCIAERELGGETGRAVQFAKVVPGRTAGGF